MGHFKEDYKDVQYLLFLKEQSWRYASTGTALAL
jgi:hypothetical protein